MTPASTRPRPTNEQLAAQLEEYSALLELAGAGYYTWRAFLRAAELIRATPASVAGLVVEGKARELRGIGPGVEARLREIVETGELGELHELRRTVSPELVAMARALGLGAPRAAEIATALGVRTLTELRAAAAEGRLREVRGIGERTEAKILAALAELPTASRPTLLLHRARVLLEGIARGLGGIPAGDPRRWSDTPRRLAVVVASEEPDAVYGRFAALPEIVTVIEPNIGITLEGVPVEVHVAPSAELGTALVRATGSQEYVAGLEPLPAAVDEETVYRLLGRPFAPPELREAGLSDPAGPLVTLGDIRGDLHVHTRWSDGKATVLEMAEAAKARGYDYIAICDHTESVVVVPGLDGDAVRRQGEEIAAVNERLAPFRVLRGIECDIRRDGTLDLPDDVLAELDWVQLSLHAGQRAPRAELTKRVLEAMRHPAVRCLSHPTGRMIGRRPENALDLEETIEVALATGVALEVNGLPDRLDLRGDHVRLVAASGAMLVCSTDAHSVRGLDNMELSVHTARRGGAASRAVLNTAPLGEILQKKIA